MDTGVIGLGTMGRAMAANLLKAGHHGRGWNRSQEPVRALAGQGATACASPTEAFQAGVVISMLADDAAVRQVLSEDVLAGAPQSAIHVNMATISVALAKELAQVHAEHEEPYRANVVKLAGNFMLGCAIEAMAEACAMAQAHDVAPADVLEMLTNSLFSSPVYKGYGAL